jgi:hypothetical protein
MRTGKKLRRVASILVIALILFFAITPLLFREPKYEGKTIREWIYALDPHVDARAQHDEAAEVLRRIGTNGVPVIASILSEPKGGIAEQFRNLAEKFGVIRREILWLGDRQHRASRAAYKLAEDANVDISSLVPLLSHHLTNSNYAEVENGRALANAGPTGVSVLTNLSTHPDVRIRHRAVWSLQYARKKPGVFETYLRAGNDPNLNLRFTALSSLSRYSDADPALLLPLGLKYSRSTNMHDRWAALLILSRCRTNDLAVAALRNAMEDPDSTVRSVAERALK